MADVKAFKKLISSIESDSNPDAVHKTLTKGIHKNTAAMGELGLMPNTAQLIARRKVRDGDASDLDAIIAAADPKSIPALLEENPHKYEEYGTEMASEVLNKSQGSPAEAYMRWKHGQNLSDEDVQKLLKSKPKLKNKIESRLEGASSQPDNYVDTLLKDEKDRLYSKIRKTLGVK